MKDSEFLELLNLYLDHEISAEDAARIEAEVQRNPARRRIYQQYCRVQKACTLLAKDYVGQSVTSGSSHERKIVTFEPSRSWGFGVYAGGLAVAAACVALVLVSRSNLQSPNLAVPNSSVAASPAPATSELPAMGQSGALVDDATRSIARSVPATAPAVSPAVSLANDNAAAVLTNGQPQTIDAQFAWLKDMQFAPIQRTPANQLRFDSKTEFIKITPQTFGPGRPQTAAQSAAFQFQR